eukprot:CAMPEP_0115840310 /NCGR_PEP_ID=MMETSP0287-20121206/6703_1 /TAXON_ID=412157 /ORGANISM="Chrysochromulina rotalis, Strain UIO044" /LENGTH=460 /DNA_ID=CAMNT_0003293913 /DNA_START=42 /DNA_END=1424 /DNA_ORIENTATION=+
MLVMLLAVAMAPAATASDPIPGLEDVCAQMSEIEKCSPEICKLDKPYVKVQLEARTYYQDREILLPVGVNLVGRGINHTFIVSCGSPSSGRRGLLLNNHTHLGYFTWQGLQASRGNFDAAIGTPGCLQADCQGGCIPADGNCAGVQNATAEYIHVASHANANAFWPLSTSAGWFPKTRPWGPLRLTGSVDITLRGIVSWGTWADGINFHGGHHNILIEGCEMSFSGDDPYGLWPSSADAEASEENCQQNIVLRDNVARWPRQYDGMAAGGKSPRDFTACDCSDAASGCYTHACYATYSGGKGIQWLNNRCEGAYDVVRFLQDFDSSSSKWCGNLTEAGSSYVEMADQGTGCRLETSSSWCTNLQPNAAHTIGGQCTEDEPLLPPPCSDSARFASCLATPGMGGACYNQSGPVLCLSAAQLAAGLPCNSGFVNKCTLTGPSERHGPPSKMLRRHETHSWVY